jgi:hypothetical protein
VLSQSLDDLERARAWLHEQTGASPVSVRTVNRDAPLAATVLLSGVQGLPRLADLWNHAIGMHGDGLGTDQVDPTAPGHREQTFDPLF